ncbi:Short-chain dehydrogenase TIC 32-like protein [Lachnellula arida]|uniref:Short-chain dehydrogenase TIC 32-like protein n=1 Tax=Lachnellula arida TaxID=1316785 RepID=A0A8T9BLL5_9HELO|nr:Short-chain dehydrogenase TIC 32-like protein [Lachnellula arida]
MAARNPEKGHEAVADIKRRVPGVAAAFLELDLSSFESVKEAARTVLACSTRLDILMLNAGLMGCPPQLTKEGYEIQMGTNHIGHALLLKLLTPLLLQTSSSHPVRVVSLASSAWKHAGPEKIQFETLKSLEGVTPVNRYIQSKVANMLYPQEFAKHYPQLTIVSVDPGDVATQLFSREPGDEQMRYLQTELAPKRVRPVEEGVVNQLWAATGEGVTSGLHYGPVGVYEPTGLAIDTELAKKVWEWTQKELEGQEI